MRVFAENETVKLYKDFNLIVIPIAYSCVVACIYNRKDIENCCNGKDHNEINSNKWCE